MRQNKNRPTWFCIGGSGLDQTDEFQKFCGQDWIEFNFCRSALDSDWKNSHSAHFWWTPEMIGLCFFCYPILSCLRKMITVSDPNPVFIEIILSVSKNYPNKYYDANHAYLSCVYFASLSKITAGVILPLA